VPVPVLIPNENETTGARPTLPSHQNAVVVVGEAALAPPIKQPGATRPNRRLRQRRLLRHNLRPM